MPTVAINGLGRIGRAALKVLLDADGLDIVAVNEHRRRGQPRLPDQVRHRLRALSP